MLLSTQNKHLMDVFGAERSIDILKEAGYDAIDLSLTGYMQDDSHVFNSADFRTRAREIRAYADGLGIPFNQSHAPFVYKWKNNPNEYEDRCIPQQIRALEIAAIVGAKIIIVHPIHYMTYAGHEREIFEFNMKFYRRLLPYAREFDIKIALENMWRNDKRRGYIVDSACSRAKELAEYVDTLDDEHFVACLDIGHCGLVGEEPWDAIRILGHDRLKALHVHDTNYRVDEHTLPGVSAIDYEQVMKALSDIDYDGDFTFEADAFLRNFPTEFKPTAAHFMVEMGRYLMGRFQYYQSQK